MITEWVQEQLMEEEDNQWILGSLKTISKMANQSVLTATNMDIWQKNAEQKRKNEKHEFASNATRRDTLQRTARGSK